MKKLIRAAAVLLAVAICMPFAVFAAENDDIISCQWKQIVQDDTFFIDELNGVKAYPWYQCNDLPIRYYSEVYGIDIFVGVYSPFLMENSFSIIFGSGISDYGDIPDEISGFTKTDSPKTGDIVYWSATRRGKDYAHSALVKSYSDGVITLIEQNWNWDGKAAFERKIKFPSDNYVVYTLDGVSSGSASDPSGTSGASDTQDIAGTTVAVSPSTQPVELDGRSARICAYNIDGSNYFKLRDLACLLSGTETCFNVGYDEETKAVLLIPGEDYQPVGGELEGPASASTGIRSRSRIYLNGEPCDLTAYNIGGNNYFMLRELGELLGFGVEYDEGRRTVCISSSCQSPDDR